MAGIGARILILALSGALLLAAGCAVTPDLRPSYVRKLADPPAQPFTSIVIVFMPIARPANREMASEYDRLWRDPKKWREPFFQRLRSNFGHNGIDLTVFDASVPGRVQIEPTMLQVRMTAESVILDSGWIRFTMRGEASNRDTHYAAFNRELYLQRSPERSADRETYLILNTLRDLGLIKSPAAGKDYGVAPS